jgi:serine/threonine protein kinase
MPDPADILLERLRRALTPEFEVERELGAGGMGVVFLGRDTALDMPVAIKVLRPELATAVAAERFLREGQLLARLDHPNIVDVHHAGQRGGLFYFVMDYIKGERLSDRVKGGPLAAAAVRRLGRELLDALAAIHTAGTVHRDIKPANVLFKGDRAILIDFGIATSGASHSGDLTTPGAIIGTLAYMAPEAAMGEAASVRSDLWSVGTTLFEAATGRRYDGQGFGTSHEVPADLALAIGRSLELDPVQRWPDAAAFRDALKEPAPKPVGRLAAVGAVALVGVAIAGAFLWSPSPAPERPSLRRLVLEPLAAAGRVTLAAKDSIEQALTRRLTGYPDFELDSGGREAEGALRLRGRLTYQGEGLRFDATLSDDGRPLATLSPSVLRVADWPDLVDSVGDRVVMAILVDSLRSDPWIPSFALPRSPDALRRFVDGERSFASGQWEDALTAYLAAERADSTCLLCSYRLEDVARWMNDTHDPARVKRLQAAADRFPPHYRTLILAEGLPIAERLDTLEAAVQRYRNIYLVWYRYGEELFHRGPLVGRLRAEAGEAFRNTVELRPGFAPAWYHLAGMAITDGDSVGADSALAEFQRLEGSSTGVPFAQLGLLLTAKAWRFGGGAAGPATTDRIISDPRMPSELLAAGPRLFLAARAWDGAIWLGRVLEGRSARSELVRAGLIAQSLAHIAQGRPDSSVRTADRLESAVADDATRVFAAGLPAVLALVSSDSLEPDAVAPHLGRLRRFLDPGASGSGARRAAGFLLGALALASDQPAVLREAERGLGSDRLGLGFRALLGALAAHRRGSAAASADSILLHEIGLLQEQPAARAVARFWEARSHARAGRAEPAVRTLRWVEHEDVIGLPTRPPLAAELEWALGPLARFEESAILDRAGIDRGRLCRLLAGTSEGWGRGTATFAERARRAGERQAALSCEPAA